MTVITISREIGSEGSFVANEVARILNYKLITKSILENILSQYGFVQFDKEYETSPNFWERLDETRISMIEMLNRVILATASLGNAVILGRGGFAVLGGFSDVLNVRLQAPFALRVKRMMAEKCGDDQAAAEALVKESDRVRAGFMQSWYGVRWDTATYFDLVIDTSKISRQKAVDWILDAQRSLPASAPDDKSSLKAVNIDPVMIKTVQEVLEQKPVFLS